MDVKRLFVDFHVIQTVPPSCVNRDDTGSPKTATYGGVTRARVSSQAWKHAMREYFKLSWAEGDLAVRSRRIIQELAEEIKRKSGMDSPEALEVSEKALQDLGFVIQEGEGEESKEERTTKSGKGKKKQGKNNAEDKLKTLFFISRAQISALADAIIKGYTKSEDLVDVLNEHPNFEIALFGRMAASNHALKCDAASQVAHSISTHEVHTEFDYFTALDDLSTEENLGAGHLGIVEFNSSTMYRYATINVRELERQQIGEVDRVVRSFAEAFIYSMPTGRQNPFANRTVPDAVYITIREDQPVNFCGAFEEAINSSNGYSKPSILRLVEYANKSYQNFVEAPKYEMGTGEDLEGLCVSKPMKKNLDLLEEYVRDLLNNTEAAK
ncbi:type I-E CRISPR-associated protein Cas7/Cse4/CasC [Stomatobaculum longum]|jgi:CRISPR system CASCADE complex protein casC|uniref:type I-E CRISPR-associated protein Cas7/Cse4/CasC n=1 Tax=Stomatobaculum longum TaxID=796942 RepID=UPI0028E78EBC|nr:type I-E CRISPR-associated protein Cas7/Cse4/CasC [Stomatobaculum longum]